uniref:Tetraspanin n=1 Tax=Mola mola TaxID=94237 RepID=A0A3Q3XKE0_MOLML
MTEVNSRLKRSLTIFNIIFAIVGFFILGLTLVSQLVTSSNGRDDLQRRSNGILMLYILGVITMMVTIIGAYGAHKENKFCLNVFLVCMLVGFLLMLKSGIATATTRPEMEELLKEKFRELLPLDKVEESVKRMLDDVQSQQNCCGVFGYKDWGDNIPDSCLCDQQQELSGLCQTVNSTMPQQPVYAATCFSIILDNTLLLNKIMIGIIFTLATLALLGFTLSTSLVCRMRSKGARTTN